MTRKTKTAMTGKFYEVRTESATGAGYGKICTSLYRAKEVAAEYAKSGIWCKVWINEMRVDDEHEVLDYAPGASMITVKDELSNYIRM